MTGGCPICGRDHTRLNHRIENERYSLAEMRKVNPFLDSILGARK